MRLYFSGCSWTYGQELEDREKSRFSTLVGEHFKAEVINTGKKGSSIQRMLRATYELCNPKEIDAAILQFTMPARNEYFVDGLGWKTRDDSFTGLHPKRRPEHMSPYLLPDHWEYMQHYYKTAYTEEYGLTQEYIVFQALQDYFARHNVPVVTMTLNSESPLPFDIFLRKENLPLAPRAHPTEEGHKIIADKIQKILEQRLDKPTYANAKESHLTRIKRLYENLFNPIDQTDYR